MKNLLIAVAAAALAIGLFAAPAAADVEAECWGQATKAFAATGEMGEHSASFETPRLGIRNLARELADAGIIPDDSMAALGVFVVTDLGLTVEACQ
jgi:hypothetical protein